MMTIRACVKAVCCFTAAAAAFTVLSMMPAPVQGATYYVDFEGGDDGSDGLGEGTAFKHAPGDPEAGGNAASTALQPGDIVLFRGGVPYRGTINIDADGASGNPVTYKGDGWGAERAVIDGADPLEGGWSACESQAACGDNPGWSDIFYTDAPDRYNFFTTLFEDGEFLWFSQDPNPDDPFYYDRFEWFRVVPLDDTSIVLTRTSLTDPSYLTQEDAAFWDNATIAVWRIPNVVTLSPVTGFDPATDTLSFEDIGGDLYDDRDEYYAMLNNLSLVDYPGEVSYDPDAGRIYLWPLTPEDPALHDMSVAVRRVGIDIRGHSHIVVEGFVIRNHFGDFVEHNLGVGIRSTGSGDIATDIVIRNNEITKHRTMEGSGAIRLYNVADVIIENNTVTDNQRSVGILAGGSNIVVRGNSVSRTSRQGIWFMDTHDSMIVGNRVTDIRGTHANGISVYLNSSNILVANNYVTNAPSPFTFEASDTLTVMGNVFDAADGESNVNEWGSEMTGTILFFNNVMVRNSRNAALNIGNGATASYVVRNNIIDGMCPTDAVEVSHNIYTGLEWCQDPDTDFGEGDILEEDLGAIFVDAAGADFHLFEGSAAMDVGTDVSFEVPASAFPSFDFLVDMDGVPRPQGGGWDRGAYEYTTAVIDEIAEAVDPAPDAAEGAVDADSDAQDVEDAAADGGEEGEDGGGDSGCGCVLAV
jgi:parallel beta-helix repeat protein